MLRSMKLSATVVTLLGVTSTVGASLANTNISMSLGVALGGIVALVILNLVRSK